MAVGAKLVENRAVNIKWRGEIAIHAGMQADPAADSDSRIIGLLGENASHAATRGAIVAVARLVGCHQARQPDDPSLTCCGRWGMRLYRGKPAWHLVLADVRRLPKPVPCRGYLHIGWWAKDAVEAEVRAQLDSSLSAA
ncbi:MULTISPECIES: hypothetical protein [unclassified Actinoplanes]|uniref:hypothetical protein n=1 Tax=unclassified Actinoplanes TaxID=2626549 RepID=UPI00030BB203|nr:MULTISPECIES: hypothetical protein [unclassified Actinoplanes]